MTVRTSVCASYSASGRGGARHGRAGGCCPRRGIPLIDDVAMPGHRCLRSGFAPQLQIGMISKRSKPQPLTTPRSRARSVQVAAHLGCLREPGEAEPRCPCESPSIWHPSMMMRGTLTSPQATWALLNLHLQRLLQLRRPQRAQPRRRVRPQPSGHTLLVCCACARRVADPLAVRCHRYPAG
jgi:hypothetical protein